MRRGGAVCRRRHVRGNQRQGQCEDGWRSLDRRRRRHGLAGRPGQALYGQPAGQRRGDGESAAILSTIYREEIGHVAAGVRWFERLCAGSGLDPVESWARLVARHFKGALKPPFNEAARTAAGMTPDWYRGLA